MKKFFLFRKEELNASSVTASDNGAGLSVIALPADSLAFASAELGAVILSFNNASKYEDNNLTDGESIEKTTVRIPCEVGEEVALIESILSFMAREGGKALMKFDAVDASSTFSNVSFDSKIESRLHVNPTKRLTGDSSTQSFIGSTGTVGADVVDNTIAGIDFGIAGNKPTIDFNHEGLSSYAANAEIGHNSGNTWPNAGTGGDTYDIESNVGSPKKINGGDAKSAISKDFARFLEADHLLVPKFEASGAYTAYVVFSFHLLANLHPIYGSSTTETFGPFISQYLEASGAITKLGRSYKSLFSGRHEDILGDPFSVSTDNTDGGSSEFVFPILGDTGTGFDMHLNVMVIRRDEEGNMYLYNRDGELVAYVPAYVSTSQNKLSATASGRTDGKLTIERLGTTGDLVTKSFNGNIARFGVIEKDIGAASCSKLATDLFNLYKI